LDEFSDLVLRRPESKKHLIAGIDSKLLPVFSYFVASLLGIGMPIRHAYDASSRKDKQDTPSRSFQHRADKKRLQLERKLAASQLAHELAHEINNPLEALTNLLFLLSRLAASPEDEALHQQAEQQLARITTLVHSILALDQDHDAGVEYGSRLLDPKALSRYKKRYEQAMHLAAIVESASDAIYSKKLDGTIMAWNSGAEQLFGYSSSEALGKSIRMLVPRDLPDDERMIMDKLRRGLRIESYETTRVTKEDQLIRVSVTVSPIFNTSGRVVGASTIARRSRS